ncbi:hypothetical protein [Erythrobacter sp. R86502]|uniref:hypothetical protein n=1 Tax=Erythrobacter sp. R86502 TaxID=3093846 RepID=UPI0036D2B3FD
MTKKLDRLSLLAACKPKLREIKLPAGTLYAKQWLVAEADEINAVARDMAKAEGDDNRRLDQEWRKLVIRYSITDDLGVHLFDNDNIDEYLQLPQETVDLLIKQALFANGVKEEQLEAVAKAGETPNPN